jgi:histidinol phosphatase-like PHP family hydrolase
MNENRLLAVAAGVVFYGLLAVFPALTAFVSLYGLMADPSTIHEHLSLATGVLPQGALNILNEQLTRLTSHRTSALSAGFIGGLLVALWSANAGAKAIMDALNVAYGETEKRSFVHLNVVALAFTLGAIVALMLALGAVVIAPIVLSQLGLSGGSETIIGLTRWPIVLGLELLRTAEKHLKEARPEIIRITRAGDSRRGSELAGDLSLVAEVPKLPGGPKAITAGGQLTAHLTDAAHYGITLLLATGSDAHVTGLRAVAAERKLILDEKGLRRGGKVVAAATEEAICKALGMQTVPPELREGRDEIARALAGTLPDLVTDSDIAGILHAHTDRSDGVDTLETMAEATRSRGYQYFGVCDHSKSARYAGGLSVEEIAEQQREADALNRKYGSAFRIFKGIESDILPDGSLDYPDDVLAGFDLIVASVHGQFKMDRAAQTERIIRAVSKPYTATLGHMTGRQLLRRPGYDIDIEKVLAACAEYGVSVEINANPWRLDLDWRWHETALRLGCMMSINPDAHSTREIDLTHWGVEMARKGGVPKERVLNCLNREEFAEYLANRRNQRRGKHSAPRRRIL